MKKSIIVFRQNKFLYIEGIEEPKINLQDGVGKHFKKYEQFQETLKTEGVEVDTEDWYALAYIGFPDKYGTDNIKDLDWIYIEPNQVDIREGKCYLV